MDKTDDFPFDDDLISASKNNFYKQMKYVAKHYKVINFKQLHQYLEGNKSFPEKTLIITFDDGYIDNYQVAYPILAELKLTAVMFVTAGYIGTDKIFWWDKIAYIIKNTSKSQILIEKPFKQEIRIKDQTSRVEVSRFLIKQAKKLSDAEKGEFIIHLSDITNVRIDNLKHKYTMDWEQLKELSSNGYEIGSHSINHPIFSNITKEQIAHEVKESKTIIETKLGTNVITFGAPGRGILNPNQKKQFEDILEEQVREAGYLFSTHYKWGLVSEKEFDPLKISRIGIETYDSMRLFKSKLLFPEIVKY